MTFCISLGLRLPSEPTLKLMTSIWIVCAESASNLQEMTGFAKHALYQHMKRSFDRSRRLASDPVTYVEVLPPKPLQLMQSHELLFKQCFKELLPVDLVVPEAVILEFDQTYACRGGGRSAESPKAVPTIATEVSPGSSLERLASLFMDRIETPDRLAEVGGSHREWWCPTARPSFAGCYR